MHREPLDSLEYESTYLELRPTREQLGGTTNASALGSHPAVMHVDGGAIPSTGTSASAATISVQAVRWPRTQAVHPSGGPPTPSLRVTGRCGAVAPGHLASITRLRPWTLLGACLMLVMSSSVGIVAGLDLRAARGLFVTLTGALIIGWACLAWRATPRAGPFGVALTKALDRLVAALGTFFAIALWARYAPHASRPLSRMVVLLLCGCALIQGLRAAARGLPLDARLGTGRWTKNRRAPAT